MENKDSTINAVSNPPENSQLNSQTTPNPNVQFDQQPQTNTVSPQQKTNPNVSKSSNNKILSIIASIVICLGIIGCIVVFLVPNNNPSNPNNQSDASQTNSPTQENTEQLVIFENLTKD